MRNQSRGSVVVAAATALLLLLAACGAEQSVDTIATTAPVSAFPDTSSVSPEPTEPGEAPSTTTSAQELDVLANHEQS